MQSSLYCSRLLQHTANVDFCHNNWSNKTLSWFKRKLGKKFDFQSKFSLIILWVFVLMLTDIWQNFFCENYIRFSATTNRVVQRLNEKPYSLCIVGCFVVGGNVFFSVTMMLTHQYLVWRTKAATSGLKYVWNHIFKEISYFRFRIRLWIKQLKIL